MTVSTRQAGEAVAWRYRWTDMDSHWTFTTSKRATDNARRVDPHVFEAEPLIPASDLEQVIRERDGLREVAGKLAAAISWLEKPFIDSTTSEAELRKRIAFMIKDAELPLAFLANLEKTGG